MIAETHIWRTKDGRLVPDGDPDAAVLAYPRGHSIPESIAAKAKLKPADKAKATPEDKAAAVADGPNNPRRIFPQRGSSGDDERDRLLAQAKERGLRGLGKAKNETIARKIAEFDAPEATEPAEEPEEPESDVDDEGDDPAT